MRRTLVAAFLCGCSFDLGLPEGAHVVCETPADCPAGNVCRESIGRCLPSEGGDLTAPTVRDVVLTERVGIGGSIEVSFEASEELLQPPVVELATAADRRALALVGLAGRRYTFGGVITGAEPEGTGALVVAMVDTSGNTARDVALGNVTLDLQRPSVTDLGADVSALRAQQTVTLTLQVSEPLAALPTLTLSTGAPLAPSATADPRVFTCSYQAVGDETQALAVTAEVELTDLAGNSGAHTSGELFRFDFIAPARVGAATLSRPAARHLEVVGVEVTVSEALAADPRVWLRPQGGGADLAMSIGARVAGAYTFIRQFAVADPDATHDVEIEPMVDLAGNVGGGGLLGSLRLDNAEPAPEDASVAPALVKASDVVTVSFTVNDLLATSPVVTIGGVEMDALDDVGPAFSFSYTVPTGSPGSKAVVVELRDAANNISFTTLGQVTYDFTAPGIAIATVTYDPDSANPLQTPTRATGTTRIVVTVVADELLSPTDPPTLIASNGVDVLTFDVFPDPSSVTFEAIPAGYSDGDYVAQLTWSDVAGNSASPALPVIEITTSTPTLVVEQGQVSYLRSPWGQSFCEALDTDPTCRDPQAYYEIPAGPHFALAPADPLSPDLLLPASTFQLSSGAPLARVRVWADASLETLVGTMRPSAGGWPRLRLANVDAPFVFVTGIDEAGNESAPVVVEKSEWVATPRPPAFGQSPHRLQATEYANAARVADSTVTRDADLPVVAWANPTWRERPKSILPEIRGRHAMVYDSGRGRMVVFAGYDTFGRRDDIWEWDGAHWTGPVRPAVRPSARMDHAMVYDSGRGRVVLFGGQGESGLFGDTWEWDGATWRELSVVGPSPRAYAAMAYDSSRRRIVLFGGDEDGDEANGVELDDTWEWDGAVWSGPLPSVDKPSPRIAHAMAFDAKNGKVVLVGGAASGVSQDDLWEWDAGGWIERTPTGNWPVAHRDAALAYDVARERLVLFGGVSTDYLDFLGAVWEWDGGVWHGPYTPPGPSARSFHTLAYDSARQHILLFGGMWGDDAYLSDSWSWDGATWTGPLVTAAWQTAVRGHAAAYDSERGVAVKYGGASGSAVGDHWEWDGRVWVERTPVPNPGARYLYGMVFDTLRKRTVFFGGASGAMNHDDVWHWDGLDWSGPLPASGPRPSARINHALAFDEARDVTVMFGSTTDNAVWEWDGSAWAGPFSPSLRPSGRREIALAFDAANDVTMMFGGINDTATYFDEVWLWDGSSWTGPLLPSPRPEARVAHAMAYDAARGRIVLFGGNTASSGRSDETWEWDGSTWAGPFLPQSRPAGRAFHTLVYDSTRGHVVLFGGLMDGGYADDVWEWDALPERRPAVQFTASYAGAGITRDAVTGLRIRARCGGESAPFDAPAAGARLSGWGTGGPGRPPGEWVALPGATSSAGVGSTPPYLPSGSTAAVSWSAADAAAARGYLVDGARDLAFRCESRGTSALGRAGVALENIEVRLQYQAP